MPTALEAMPDELFDQVLCLLLVAGIIAFFIVKAFKGTDNV